MGNFMETVFKQAIRLMSAAALLALAACSGGGGGGAAPATAASNTASSSSNSNSSSSNSSNSSSSSNSTATPPACSTAVCITAPAAASAGGATPLFESGAGTPNFSTNAPPLNTVFPLTIAALQTTQTSVKDAGITSGTVTFQGVTSSGGTNYPIFELKVPSIGLDAPNLSGSGTPATLSDGSTANAVSGVLNYASMGGGAYFPKSTPGTNYIGEALTGYQTQTGHVPASGSATYIGSNGSAQGAPQAGGVAGQIYAPNAAGTAVTGGGIGGSASVSVNFASGAVSGQLTNMFSSSSALGTNPWNTVNLSGSLSGSSVSGTTSTTAAPANAGIWGMSAAATGKFNGALYGPNVNEFGAIWSLYEPTSDGGKAVLGVIGATHQ